MWKKKIPQRISWWILVAGTALNLIIHQHRDYQTHQELYLRQQQILQTYQEVEQILVEQTEIEINQTELYQEILGLLQEIQRGNLLKAE